MIVCLVATGKKHSSDTFLVGSPLGGSPTSLATIDEGEEEELPAARPISEM